MSDLDRPPWPERKFAFGSPLWMLADFTERLRGLVPRLARLLDGLDEGSARRQFDDKWSIAQNAGHLADVEDLWQERLEDLRRGREIYTLADPARFQAAAQRHQTRTLDAIVAEMDERRNRLVEALNSASPELQAASALHERLKTPMRLVDCAQFYAEHDDHHLLRIRALRPRALAARGRIGFGLSALLACLALGGGAVQAGAEDRGILAPTTCIDRIVDHAGKSAPVTVDLADGTSRRGLGLRAQGDSIYFRTDPAGKPHPQGGFAAADVLGARIDRKTVDAGLGFGIAGFVLGAGIGGASAAGPSGIIVGIFGGLFGAALGSALAPDPHDFEEHIECQHDERAELSTPH